MNAYQVTFGDTVSTVYAEDEKTAWAKFAEGNDLARVHPSAFARTVELVPPAPEPVVDEPPVPKKKK